MDLLSGACMLVRADAIAQVGLMDERFRLYAEDVDWCFRIRKAGWQVYYTAQNRIFHYGGKSTVKLKWMAEGYLSINKYYLKHYAPLHGLIYRSIVRFIAVPSLFIMHGIVPDRVHSGGKSGQLVLA